MKIGKNWYRQHKQIRTQPKILESRAPHTHAHTCRAPQTFSVSLSKRPRRLDNVFVARRRECVACGGGAGFSAVRRTTGSCSKCCEARVATTRHGHSQSSVFDRTQCMRFARHRLAADVIRSLPNFCVCADTDKINEIRHACDIRVHGN